jgi:hypothetical protein
VAGAFTVHLVSEGVVAGLLSACLGFIRYIFIGLRDSHHETAETVARHGERIAAIEGRLAVTRLE